VVIRSENGTRGERSLLSGWIGCGADLERRGRRVADRALHKKGSPVVAWVVEGKSTVAINNIYQPPDHPIVIVSAHPNPFPQSNPSLLAARDAVNGDGK